MYQPRKFVSTTNKKTFDNEIATFLVAKTKLIYNEIDQFGTWHNFEKDADIELITMRRKGNTISTGSSDADYAAGGMTAPLIGNAPLSRENSVISATSDIEFYEDLISDPVLVLGVDISHLSRNMQFVVCASGVFFFSLLYGYLQELLSVKLCSRQLGLYLAMVQFTGYTFLAYLLRSYVYKKQQRQQNRSRAASADLCSKPGAFAALTVPFKLYLGLSLLRAVDLAMTNLAMQYINYPAKTLMKSSRVVFTMIFGVCITRKRYGLTDYAIVLCMVFGLIIFMHADATSSAIFEPSGVIMLVRSIMIFVGSIIFAVVHTRNSLSSCSYWYY